MSYGLVRRGVPLSRLNDMVEADVIMLADCSGSMMSHDAGDGHEERWSVLNNVLAQVRQQVEGKVVVLAFNDDVMFVDVDLPRPSGGTDIGGALGYLNREQDGVRFSDLYERIILISDGEPTVGEPSPEEAAFREAKATGCPVDVLFVGRKGSLAELVLETIARRGGGRYMQEALTDALTQTLLKMLPGG